VIVDFAHTPNGLKSALSALKTQLKAPRRLIAVFGCAGKRDANKRPLMGEIAASLADEVVVTSEDPRSEDPRVIIHQIKAGAKTNHGHLHGIVDRQQAINFAIAKLAMEEDTVVVLGKGHEASLNLDGKHEIPWSDVTACQNAITFRSPQ
jgi:UDP-N-acetylmuramoyl-L-alanyl-D-glutamate--2,6-diaminopimelate ligase